MRLIKILLGFTLISFFAISFAGIKAAPLTLEFGTGAAKTQNISIENTGKKKEYVTVSAFTRTKTKDGNGFERHPLKRASKEGLLITPTKFVLKKGKGRKIRVTLVKPLPNKDKRIFLVVQPVKNLKEKSIGGEGSSAKLLVREAYDIGVILHKKDGKPVVKLEKLGGNKYEVVNSGDTMALVRVDEQCGTADCPRPYVGWLGAGVSKKFEAKDSIKVSQKFLGNRSTIYGD